ncbi:MAG: SurA N-terminal domain-containing protein [Dissulfurispiraceae bacterium]
MLQSMRKHAKFFYFLFFIVILSFVFWGVGSLDKSASVNVAEIGKEKISVEEYWKAYEGVRARFRDTYKENFDEEMEKKLNLKETVLNSLIDERVLLLSAKELGLTVTDKELQEVIVNDPRFMRDGVFRKDIYFKTLELNRLTPEMFETSTRQQLLELKMRRLVWSAVDVTQADLRNMPTDEKTAQMMTQALLLNERDAALRSYIDNLKGRMVIKIKKDVIS